MGPKTHNEHLSSTHASCKWSKLPQGPTNNQSPWNDAFKTRIKNLSRELPQALVTVTGS